MEADDIITISKKYTPDQLHEVAVREVALRKAVYSKKVLNGKMTKEEARFQYDAMRVIAWLLEQRIPSTENYVELNEQGYPKNWDS